MFLSDLSFQATKRPVSVFGILRLPRPVALFLRRRRTDHLGRYRLRGRGVRTGTHMERNV